MAKNTKQSTIDAINKFSQRQLDEYKPKELRAKHGKPEKEVEKACLEWMRSQGWSVQIFEAKATWSPAAGRWLQQAMKAGTCDCLGNTDAGISVAIEFKAPGALQTFNSDNRQRQKKFIIDKINTNVFACVVDSVEKLMHIYARWLEIRTSGAAQGIAYLMSELPKESEKRKRDDRPLDAD